MRVRDAEIRSLGRSAILIEIKEEYAALASVRGNLAQPAIETFILRPKP